MSTPNNRRRDPGGLSAEAVLVWIAALVLRPAGSLRDGSRISIPEK